MSAKLRDMSVEERIKLVEDLWDGIADEVQVSTLTAEQRAELDRRLDGYVAERPRGRSAASVVAEIRRRF